MVRPLHVIQATCVLKIGDELFPILRSGPSISGAHKWGSTTSRAGDLRGISATFASTAADATSPATTTDTATAEAPAPATSAAPSATTGTAWPAGETDPPTSLHAASTAHVRVVVRPLHPIL